MAADPLLHPEDCDDEVPNLTKSSFNLKYGPGGSVEAYCGSGISLISPLFTIFCEHVVDASVMPPGTKAFTCPHKGCGEVVPRCDTRELSLAYISAALDRLHPKPNQGGAKAGGKRKKAPDGKTVGGGKKRHVPPSPRVGTRRSQRIRDLSKRMAPSSPSVVCSSPPPAYSSPPEASSQVPNSINAHNQAQPSANASASAIILEISDSESNGDKPAPSGRRQGGGSRNDPIVLD